MDLLVGCLVLILAIALASHADARIARLRKPDCTGLPGRPAEQRKPFAHRVLERGEVPVVLLVSLALNLPGPAYLVSLKDIAAAHDDPQPRSRSGRGRA